MTAEARLISVSTLMAGALALGCSLLAVQAKAEENAERAAAARAYLATIQHDPQLQGFLDATVNTLLIKDARAREAAIIGIALMSLAPAEPPRLAHWNGNTLIYPASVVKFVYLMAAYAWEEQGMLRVEGALDSQLTSMIYQSSNRATQKVFRSLTETEAGSELSPRQYVVFRERRLRVKRWLETLGVSGIHSIHPTYDGGGDLFGRDIQLLQDGSMQGGISNASGKYKNRQAMTAVGTAKLLALLASDHALSPENSAEVRQRMKRNPAKQPYLSDRIAGGALQSPGVEVFSKTGTWGPIFADAGIIRSPSGRQLVLAVFVDSNPPYRGKFIAELAKTCTQALLGP